MEQPHRFKELKQQFQAIARHWKAARHLEERSALLITVREMTGETNNLILECKREWFRKQFTLGKGD